MSMSEQTRIKNLIVRRACNYRDHTRIAEAAALDLETNDSTVYTSETVDDLSRVADEAEQALFVAVDYLRESAARKATS